MRYFLLFLMLSLAGVALGQGTQSWEVPAFTVTFERPANAGSSANSVWYVDGVQGSTANVFSSGGPGAGTRTYNHAYRTHSTPATAQSVRLVINVLLTDGTAKPVAWQQARKTGSSDPIKSGPFHDGVPVDGNGDPVDENGDPATPPADRHYAKAEYINTHDFPVTVQYIYTGVTEGIILLGNGNCEPGAKFFKDGYNWEPFSISLTPFADGQQVDDTVTEPSDPVVEGDPNHPEQPNPGDPGGPGGPVLPGGGQRPGGNQIPNEPPVPDQPRPGEGEPNTEARHKEIRGELQRIAAGINRVGNQAADDADRTNELLGGVKDSTDGVGDGVDGLKDGLEGVGDSVDGVKDAIDGLGEGGQSGLGTPGVSAGGQGADVEDQGIFAKIDAVRTGSAAVLEASQGVVSALGLNRSVSSSALSWQVSVPVFGSYTLNLDSVLGEYIPIIRNFLLFLAGLFFVFSALDEIKRIFV